MGKGKLLSVEEVGRLKESGRNYYVESTNSVVENGIYNYRKEGKEYLDNGNGRDFYIRCESVRNGDIKVYEYEEEIIIKEYTTAEVIKELGANVELKFQALRYITKEPGAKFLTIDSNKRIVCKSESSTLNDYLFADQTWILVVENVEKSVTFMEATKAFNNGHSIECKRECGYPTKYIFNIDKIGMMDESGNAVCADEILKGKWFIL